MIAQLIGKLIYKEPTYIILDVGGVGYELHISLSTFTQIKTMDHCTLFSALFIKNEVFTLYGFYTLEEKAWWLRLVSVSGIGPKIALTILSSLSPIELHKTILHKDERMLTSIKGIGIKAAKRLILELTSKAEKLIYTETITDSKTHEENRVSQDAVTALITLGLTPKIAEKAVASVRANAITSLTLEEIIKKSLQSV